MTGHCGRIKLRHLVLGDRSAARRAGRLICGALIGLCLGASSHELRAADFDAEYGQGTSKIVVATGSPGELGLLKQLALHFARNQAVQIQWKKAGSGAALKLLRQRCADVVIVHAPAAEQMAVKQGWAAMRVLIGSNEFLLVGPKQDPAQLRQAHSVVDAYRRIAQAEALFLSRGDQSGTHQREQRIWKVAGIQPAGDWYVTTHEYMLATLQKADRQGAHFMTDSSTWLAARKNLAKLKVLYRGDPLLVNHYHVLCQAGDGHVREAAATKFVDFLSSDPAQSIIANFGQIEFGEPLYFNVAETQRRAARQR